MFAKKCYALLCLQCLCTPLSSAEQAIDIASALGGEDQGFERALEPRAFEFPADHGPHPRFKNEWWYLTGQLFDQLGAHYGFQFTLFRVGLKPVDKLSAEQQWSRESLWMAHVAVSDSQQKKYWHAQRLSHGGAGSAGVTAVPFQAWLDNWRLSTQDLASEFPWLLQMATDEFELELDISTDKAPILHGQRGLSSKGGPDNASYYFSFSDLQATGQLNGFPVSGSAWFDREWSTSVLPKGVSGWDWFSLQLKDGRQLMVFQLRSELPDIPNSKHGTLISSDGSSQPIDPAAIELNPLETWLSPSSGHRYPTHWTLEVTDLLPATKIRARFDAQEQVGLVNYWEGSIEARTLDGERVGLGYLEMTGYGGN